MKRTLKNIVMILLVFVMAGAIAGTAVYAKKNLMPDMSQMQSGQMPGGNGGQMPGSDGQSSDTSESSSSTESGDSSDDSSQNSQSTQETPPAKPDGDSSDSDQNSQSTQETPPAKPDGDSSGSTDSSTPPEMPDNNGQAPSGDGQAPSGDGQAPSGNGQAPNGNGQAPSGDGQSSTDNTQSSGSTSEVSSNSSDSNASAASDSSESAATTSESEAVGSSNAASTDGTAPQMPSGSTDGQMPSMPSDMGNMSISLTLPYYIAFGAEALILALLLTYLILSGFNKKSFKETFGSGKRILAYVLVVVVLTGAVTAGSSVVTNKYVLAMSQPDMSQMTGESGMDPANGNGQGGGSSSSATYSAATEITESNDVTGETYDSTTADENALSVTGDVEVNASDITATKTGDSDGGDNTSFYGTNSAIIAKDGATLNLSGITVTTDAAGANGVFCYGGSATTDNTSGDGTTVNISDSTITTTKDNSGGIMTTGGGVTNATNLTITTSGTSSAAIRTDRGGGTVTVDNGTYTTNGTGSPTVYSTADVTVKNADLIANASEGIVIEGKNSVSLEGCNLTDSNTELNGQSTTYKNIFLYQSMSGDADTGTSEFSAKDSTITTNNGDTLYVTNTTATITLENNTITNNDADGNFLRAQADSWGNEGSNGGDVTLQMTNQKASGNIVIDSVSTLNMTMEDASSYEGTINGDNSAKELNLTLSKDSTITLTGDSYVTSLNDEDTSYANINFNGYKLYVNGTAIN